MGWHKCNNYIGFALEPCKIILLKPEKTLRGTYTVSEAVAAEWSKLVERVLCKASMIDTALTRFMEDYKDGKVTFVLDM